MLSFEKENFDENLDDIMKSVNDLLKKTGKGFESTEEEKEENNKKEDNKNENKTSPKTGDKINVAITIFIISSIGLVTVSFLDYMKKRNIE